MSRLNTDTSPSDDSSNTLNNPANSPGSSNQNNPNQNSSTLQMIQEEQNEITMHSSTSSSLSSSASTTPRMSRAFNTLNSNRRLSYGNTIINTSIGSSSINSNSTSCLYENETLMNNTSRFNNPYLPQESQQQINNVPNGFPLINFNNYPFQNNTLKVYYENDDKDLVEDENNNTNNGKMLKISSNNNNANNTETAMTK